MQTYGLGPSSLFALGLGTLVIITFLAGFIKVGFNKRELRKKINQAKIEESNKQTDLEKLVGERELDEGDLFGVRAIQAGFFGGVSQSRPNSPSVSRSSSITSLGRSTQEKTQPDFSSHNLPIPRPTYKDSRSSTSTTGTRPPSTPRVKSQESVRPGVLGTSPEITSGLDQNFTETDHNNSHSLKSSHLDKSTATTPDSHDTSINQNPSHSAVNQARDARSDPLHSSPENTKYGVGSNKTADISTSHDNIPRKLCPPAVIRDSIVSKQQVSISRPNLIVRHNSNSSSIYSAQKNVELASSQQLKSSHQHSTDDQMSNPSESDKPTIDPMSSADTQHKNEILVRTSKKSDPLISHQRQQSQGFKSNPSGSSPREPRPKNNYSVSTKISSSQSTILSNLKDSESSAIDYENHESPSNSNTSVNIHRPISSRESIDEFYDTYYRHSTMRPGILDCEDNTSVGWRNNQPRAWSPKIQDHEAPERNQPKFPQKSAARDIILELKS